MERLIKISMMIFFALLIWGLLEAVKRTTGLSEAVINTPQLPGKIGLPLSLVEVGSLTINVNRLSNAKTEYERDMIRMGRPCIGRDSQDYCTEYQSIN